MRIEITEAQLVAIIELKDEVKYSIGSSDINHGDINPDLINAKRVRLVERMLKTNGVKGGGQWNQ